MGAQVATDCNVSNLVSSYMLSGYPEQDSKNEEMDKITEAFKTSSEYIETELSSVKKQLKNVTQKYEDALDIFRRLFAVKHDELTVLKNEVKKEKADKEAANETLHSLSADRRVLERERDELLNMLFEREAKLVSSGIFNHNKTLTEMKIKLTSSGKTYPVMRPHYLK